MKHLIITLFIVLISSVNVAAQYIEGQENVHTDGMMKITTTSVVEEPRICTMEYAPVCAEVTLQCIKAPCYSAQETFSNTCSAWDNPVLFQWECSSYLNTDTYRKYESKREDIQELISELNINILKKMNESLDEKIESVKLSRIAVEVQKERITKYAFIKSVVSTEIYRK